MVYSRWTVFFLFRVGFWFSTDNNKALVDYLFGLFLAFRNVAFDPFSEAMVLKCSDKHNNEYNTNG